MESVVSAPAAPPKKNLVLITSVLYTVNGNHPMSRSIYSHDERFEQTKKTISAARKYIPNSWILFMECSPLREEHAAYIKENVDFFKNLWDTPIRGRMFTASKAMGEGTQTIYALNYLFRENMEFNHYFKISGRYFLDERFNYSKWDNDKIIIQDWNESKSVFTFLYKMSWGKHARDWYYTLVLSEEKFRRNMGYEIIYGNFVEKHAYDVEFIDVMGIEGFISPTGSHVYI